MIRHVASVPGLLSISSADSSTRSCNGSASQPTAPHPATRPTTPTAATAPESFGTCRGEPGRSCPSADRLEAGAPVTPLRPSARCPPGRPLVRPARDLAPQRAPAVLSPHPRHSARSTPPRPGELVRRGRRSDRRWSRSSRGPGGGAGARRTTARRGNRCIAAAVPLRTDRPSGPPARLRSAPRQGVEDHRHEQHPTGDHELDRGLDAHQGHTRGDRLDDEHPQQRGPG
jgi:hypothetical protein